jgi:hypothetical protein
MDVQEERANSSVAFGFSFSPERAIPRLKSWIKQVTFWEDWFCLQNGAGSNVRDSHAPSGGNSFVLLSSAETQDRSGI